MASSADDSSTALKIPACERCRLRKVKCDTRAPKCGGCKRNDNACIILDPVTRERYSRISLYELERKLKLLEDAQARAGAQLSKSPASQSGTRGPRTHFVGSGSGLQLFKELSSHSRTDVPHVEQSPLAHSLSHGSAAIAPHSLPPPDVAQLLVNHYYSHVQLHHPLLAEQDVASTFQRVYSAAEGHASPHDLYRLYMIFAVAAVTTYRRGHTHHHPYGYFRAAQRYAPQVVMVGSIRAIQNVLLVARFSMYYHVDCSIWDLARFCIRQCVALELHRPPSEPLPALEEQLRRNLFWDCYIHDRYSSGILGRPYAIAEEDITVELPVEKSEEEIASWSSLHSDDGAEESGNPNKASVFGFVIKLRRLLTRISNRFYTIHGHAQSPRRDVIHAARVKADMDRFLEELDQLRAEAPVFAEPNSLYERSDWYDFLVEKDRLTLIRGAIAQIPVDRLQPPHTLLMSSLRCATRVLNLYHSMFSAGYITWTRSYFQIMFTSGLTIMYTLSTLRQQRGAPLLDDDHALAQAARSLIATSDLMKAFVSEMPDAGRFAMVFETLVKHYTGTGTRARPSRGPSPPQTGTATPATRSREPADVHVAAQPSIAVTQTTQEFLQEGMYISDLPELGPRANGPQSEFDFNHGFDFDDFPNWSLNPGTNDNIIGQVEASLGEYAWGMAPDDTVWNQWDAFQSIS